MFDRIKMINYLNLLSNFERVSYGSKKQPCGPKIMRMNFLVLLFATSSICTPAQSRRTDAFPEHCTWWFILIFLVIMYCDYRVEKTDSFDGNHGNRSRYRRRRTYSFDGPVGKMYKTYDNSCVCEDDSIRFDLMCG